MAGAHDELPQFVNPQHTDKMFHESQHDHSFSTPKLTHGIMPSFLATPSSSISSEHADLAGASQSFLSEHTMPSSLATSPVMLSPSPSESSSSACRRQGNLLIPDSQPFFLQDCHAGSPTQVLRGPGHAAAMSSAGGAGAGVQTEWTTFPQSHTSTYGGHQLHAHSHHPAHSHHSHSHLDAMDAGYDANAAAISHAFMTGGSDVCIPTLSPFTAAPHRYQQHQHPSVRTGHPHLHPHPHHLSNRHHSSNGSHVSHVSHLGHVSTNMPTLAAPFEGFISPSVAMNRVDSFESTNSSSPPSSASSSYRSRNSSNTTHSGNGSGSNRSHHPMLTAPKPRRTSKGVPKGGFPSRVESRKNNKHACKLCEDSFRRPEHLKRHMKTHIKDSVQLPCVFAGFPHGTKGCSQTIKDRADNMRAHLQSTHFKYGKSEKGGKNKRYSMKASMMQGVQGDDERWPLLLRGQILFGDNEKRYYKMLGYNILETSEMRIADLFPGWDGPGEFIKDVDPRWTKLLEGNMTFEEAMERGEGMDEDESQGVLGVDMETSARMGLRGLDPRWRKLDEGAMDLEEAKKLKVTHYLNSTNTAPSSGIHNKKKDTIGRARL